MSKLLSTENITKKFGGVYAANSISVDIDELSVVGLIGSNGAGKTTFLNSQCNVSITPRSRPLSHAPVMVLSCRRDRSFSTLVGGSRSRGPRGATVSQI